MNNSLRDNKHQNHNFRKIKNCMKVEGIRKFFFSKRLSKTLRKPKFDCKNRIHKR